MQKDVVRVAAVGDIHCTKTAQGSIQPLFSTVGDYADILLLCGDLTDYGTVEETQIFVKEFSVVKIPMVAVLGNHDHESAQQDEVRKILVESGITVLDGESCEIHGVGFAGVKGFVGGFGRHTLGAWGEQGIKTLVREALDEALKLESALARLRTQHRIVMLHYSPVMATVVGEPEAIFPFLGSSRLEEPLLRHQVTAVFHGHAHRGTLEGATMSGTPVYNVAMPLLRANFPNSPPYRVIELSMVPDTITAPQPQTVAQPVPRVEQTST